MFIRRAEKEDHQQLGELIHAVLKQGDSYFFYANRSTEELLSYWLGKDKRTYNYAS